METNNSHSQEIAFSEKHSWDNTFAVEVVELGELREEELHLRLHLERKVERSFYEAGKALMELRDKRLYRNTHKNFEEYCRDTAKAVIARLSLWSQPTEVQLFDSCS